MLSTMTLFLLAANVLVLVISAFQRFASWQRWCVAGIDKDVPGVVIDVRRNLGGYDSMAPMMMAYFCTEPMFYEQVAYPDDVSNELTRVTDLVMEPATPVYTGPVAMLIDNFNVSTGEGFPMIMQRLERGPVIGFYGTYGSFGMSGSSIKLPGGYLVAYANSASLDENGEIQLDSDRFLQGGVLPDMRIPITEETLKAIYLENRDVLLETAIEALQSRSLSENRKPTAEKLILAIFFHNIR